MTKKTSLKWTINFSPLALKDLERLDKPIYKAVLSYLYKRLETEENPRRFGKPLSGNFKNFWRYRVEDYRIICEIKDHEFEVMTVKVAHRREVYKKLHLVKSPL